MEKEFKLAEQADLALLSEIITKIDMSSDDQLQDLALDEMDKKQPALHNLARFLYLQKEFSMDQMMEITRLLVLVWLYYKEKRKVPNVKIADPLYVEMRKKYEAFTDKMDGKSAEHNKHLMDDYLKEYPGRFLYGQLHRIIFSEKDNKLASLSQADKAFLMSNFKIMMDCFETMVDRPATLSHFN